jgi:hypothetical protein
MGILVWKVERVLETMIDSAVSVLKQALKGEKMCAGIY